MKVEEIVPTTPQSALFHQVEKEKTAELPVVNTANASLETNDIVTLDKTAEFPKEMISKGNALDALAKVIREMNKMPETILTSLYQQNLIEKTSQVLHS